MIHGRLTLAVILLGMMLAFSGIEAHADVPTEITEVCPGIGLQSRPPSFSPQGIILSTWDYSDLWAYDIRRNSRYPLSNTAPCGSNCHLSPDAVYITYHNIEESAFGRMRLDGSDRTVFVDDATEISWWSAERLLIWTSSHDAYLYSWQTGDVEWLARRGLVSVQPGGYWGVLIEYDAAQELFVRRLVDLRFSDGEAIELGLDERYFDAMAWSPDGRWLAYVRNEHGGAALVGFQPDEAFSQAGGEEALWIPPDLFGGKVRLGGLSLSSLSWSPDSRYLAFWVTPILAANPEVATDKSRIHILDTQTGEIRVYCDYATTQHTPNPPRLVWSPDGSALAFGGEDTLDGIGTMLIALTVESGLFTALSPDVVPALGAPDVVAWGLAP